MVMVMARVMVMVMVMVMVLVLVLALVMVLVLVLALVLNLLLCSQVALHSSTIPFGALLCLHCARCLQLWKDCFYISMK